MCALLALLIATGIRRGCHREMDSHDARSWMVVGIAPDGSPIAPDQAIPRVELPALGAELQPSWSFVLKVEGEKLTGTAQLPSFGPGPAEPDEISDGKVDGNNISFTVFSSRRGMDTYYKGVVSEDTIEFSQTSDFDDYGTPPVKLTAKRVK